MRADSATFGDGIGFADACAQNAALGGRRSVIDEILSRSGGHGNLGGSRPQVKRRGASLDTRHCSMATPRCSRSTNSFTRRVTRPESRPGRSSATPSTMNSRAAVPPRRCRARLDDIRASDQVELVELPAAKPKIRSEDRQYDGHEAGYDHVRIRSERQNRDVGRVQGKPWAAGSVPLLEQACSSAVMKYQPTEEWPGLNRGDAELRTTSSMGWGTTSMICQN